MDQPIINRFILIPKEKEKYEPDTETLQLLAEKWKIKILNNIGFGGFSIVKLVYSEENKQYYACKIVNILYYNIINIMFFLFRSV